MEIGKWGTKRIELEKRLAWREQSWGKGEQEESKVEE